MSETKMPATEANTASEQDLTSYEFAFHILPTVAEGEVTNVFDKLKKHITKVGGEITDEEAPKRFDLAYEIVKYLEGKNRKFGSAYFGWVRFRLPASELNQLTETFEEAKEILRFLLIKLSKVEEQNPFRFHDSIVNKQVRIVTEEDIDETEAVETTEVAEVEGEEKAAEEGDRKEQKETV